MPETTNLHPVQDFKPLNNLLVLERIQETSRGGILLPDNVAQLETNFGVVLAKGPGRKYKNGVRVPIPVEIGDRVMISSNGGRSDMTVGGKRAWLIDADNILAIMERGDDSV